MSPLRARELAYLVLGLAAVGLSLVHVRRPERLGSALDALRAVQRGTIGRWVLLLGWWWLGWHLFAR